MVSKASEDLPEPLRPDIDRVDVGSLHLVEKLAGIGGKRFHVAPLAFGVNGIESERGFAGAAQTRYRSSRRRVAPSGRETGGHRRKAFPRSAAGLRRKWYRKRARICRSRSDPL